MEKINENMTIAEALKKNPDAAKVLISYGMHCIGCAIAAGETISQAADVHGIDVQKLIKDINKAEKD